MNTSIYEREKEQADRRLTPPVRLASRRRSFTLVELLLVMMLIALLASMTLFAMHGVMEDARAARSQAQVAKINELLMDRWQAYQTRPVRVPMQANATAMAGARLNVLRELMRMEMPDRVTDVVDNPVTGIPRPSLSQRYLRFAAANPSWVSSTTHQSSECLYLILTSMQDGDSNGLDFFKSSEIGDTDNDGAKEILDAWGTPIRFCRWPAGARTQLQPGDGNPALDGDAGLVPDPFDPLHVDPRWRDNVPDNDPFAMLPLILSAGRDRQYGIAFDDSTAIHYAATTPPNDPYMFLPISGGQIGGINNATDAADNITNHLTGTN